jgi:predicted DNA-binding protein (MmcQ/YjbR family)
VTEDPRERIRAICLALPEAVEATGGLGGFRVRDKIFAMYWNNHHGDGRVAVWCKAPPGVQAALVAEDSDGFFAPPYVGPKGWIGVRLDRPVEWERLAEQIEESYRMTAPKRLIRAVDER